MRVCNSCNAELPTPLDEFGDLTAPVCWNCYIEPESSDKIKDEIAELEEDIGDLESEIENLEEQKDDLEDKIFDKRMKIRELKGQSTSKEESINNQLDYWKQGKAREVVR